MCGICGIFGDEDKRLVTRMCECQSHRGPDDHGIFTTDYLTLGHRRLSIIDLATGHQPLSNEDESIWIVYNGEIYNYQSLRAKLETQEGHQFKTESDTEVIVHLYETYGINCLKLLRGIFAFALWDANKKLLLLARDHIGVKPLYYTIHNDDHHNHHNILLFASEIKALLQAEYIPRKCNSNALRKFLDFRYVPGGCATIFEGIQKVLPGEFLVFKLSHEQYSKVKLVLETSQQFWDYPEYPASELLRTEAEAIRKLQSELKTAIKLQLMSEVPLGVYLSGGMDSSTVVALMSELIDSSIKTFTVGFEHGSDELQYARIVADHFGTDHHEIIVRLDTKLLPSIVWHLDEPVADPAIIPVYLLSAKAKPKVTVVLTGEGGDELFAGYTYYHRLLVHDLRRQLLGINRLQQLSNKFKFHSKLLQLKLINKLVTQTHPYLFRTRVQDLLDYTTLDWNIDPSAKYQLLSQYISDKGNLLYQMLHADFKLLLPDNFLIKIDRMTMAHAIEARVPILDHKFVELAVRLHPKLKLRNNIGKYIFRKAFASKLPRIIIEREKHGLGAHGIVWYAPELKELIPTVLDLKLAELKRRQYYQELNIHKLLNKSSSQLSQLEYNPKLAQKLWSLVILELWHRIYLDTDWKTKPNLDLDALI